MKTSDTLNALLAAAAVIYDETTVQALREAGDAALVAAALSPEFLAERHKAIRDNHKPGNEAWKAPLRQL